MPTGVYKRTAKHGPRFIELTGKIFGRLEVQRYVGVDKWRQSKWKCLCTCGRTVVVSGLTTGHTKSCGCLRRELAVTMGKSVITHGNAVHGKESPEYFAWRSMKQRCLNPNSQRWEHYGGRGIRVCTRWLNSFEAFLKDRGRRPKGKTLDRINPNGHYVPENVRWATKTQQNRNKRKNKGEPVAPFVDVK